MAREQLKNDACREKVTTCVEALKKTEGRTPSPPPTTSEVQIPQSNGNAVSVTAHIQNQGPGQQHQQLQDFTPPAPSPAPSLNVGPTFVSSQTPIAMAAHQAPQPSSTSMDLSYNNSVAIAPQACTPGHHGTPLCGQHASPSDVTVSAQKAALSMIQIMQQQSHVNVAAVTTPPHHPVPVQQQMVHATPAPQVGVGVGSPQQQQAIHTSTERDATAFLQNLKQFTNVFEKNTAAAAASSQIMAAASLQANGHAHTFNMAPPSQQQTHPAATSLSSSVSPVNFLQTAPDFSSFFQTAQGQGLVQVPNQQGACDPHQQPGAGSCSPPISRVVSHCSTTADFQQHQHQQTQPLQQQDPQAPHHPGAMMSHSDRYAQLPVNTNMNCHVNGMLSFGTPAPAAAATTTYVQAPAITAAQHQQQHMPTYHSYVTPHTADVTQYHQQLQQQQAIQTPMVATPPPRASPLLQQQQQQQHQDINNRGAPSPSGLIPPPSQEQVLLEHYKANALAILDSGILPRGITQRPSGKWQAQLYYAGKSRYIGVFDDRNKAVLAYEIAREELKSNPHKCATKDPNEAKVFFEHARKLAFHGVKSVKLGTIPN
jgi:hypothetical protein